jgi:hypothetical protein
VLTTQVQQKMPTEVNGIHHTVCRLPTPSLSPTCALPEALPACTPPAGGCASFCAWVGTTLIAQVGFYL